MIRGANNDGVAIYYTSWPNLMVSQTTSLLAANSLAKNLTSSHKLSFINATLLLFL